MPRPRLLPTVILAALLGLSLRLGELWSDVAVAVGTPAALAADQPVSADPPVSTDGGDRDALRAGAAFARGDADFTPAEVELLQDLSRRRDALAAREAELEARAAVLQAAEDQIAGRIAELEALRDRIEGLLVSYDEQEQANIRSLVRIYENMRPRDAARIFEALEMPVLLDVVDGMREAKSAPILAQMLPAKARDLTAELALRRQLARGGAAGR